MLRGGPADLSGMDIGDMLAGLFAPTGGSERGASRADQIIGALGIFSIFVLVGFVLLVFSAF